jgi:hypothetical protein
MGFISELERYFDNSFGAAFFVASGVFAIGLDEVLHSRPSQGKNNTNLIA